jgi:hypothetical protein
MPAARREPAAPPPGWRDPFGDPPANKAVKRPAEPKREAAHPRGFKDPFSDATPVARSHGSVVALSDSHRTDDSTAKRSSGSSSSKAGNWALLKKQSRH